MRLRICESIGDTIGGTPPLALPLSRLGLSAQNVGLAAAQQSQTFRPNGREIG